MFFQLKINLKFRICHKLWAYRSPEKQSGFAFSSCFLYRILAGWLCISWIVNIHFMISKETFSQLLSCMAGLFYSSWKEVRYFRSPALRSHGFNDNGCIRLKTQQAEQQNARRYRKWPLTKCCRAAVETTRTSQRISLILEEVLLTLPSKGAFSLWSEEVGLCGRSFWVV